MIKFTLKCDEDHRFDSWFKSAAAFDTLHSAGMVTCAVCNSTKVQKALMAPKVRDSKSQNQTDPAHDIAGPDGATSDATTPDIKAQALAALKKKVEENSEYVGMNFAREARDIHDGTAPERAIYGEAKPEEARQLIKDGVPVAPLPFVPARKVN